MPVFTIRRLHDFDRDDIRDFFRGLDTETLWRRFHRALTPKAADRYAARLLQMPGLVVAAFLDGRMCGLAELRPLPNDPAGTHEVAVIVEAGCQQQGIGDALMARLFRVAQNRGIRRLHLECEPGNAAMLHLVRKHGARLHSSDGHVLATLTVPLPTPFSWLAETAGETRAHASRIQDILSGGLHQTPGPGRLPDPDRWSARDVSLPSEAPGLVRADPTPLTLDDLIAQDLDSVVDVSVETMTAASPATRNRCGWIRSLLGSVATALQALIGAKPA